MGMRELTKLETFTKRHVRQPEVKDRARDKQVSNGRFSWLFTPRNIHWLRKHGRRFLLVFGFVLFSVGAIMTVLSYVPTTTYTGGKVSGPILLVLGTVILVCTSFWLVYKKELKSSRKEAYIKREPPEPTPWPRLGNQDYNKNLTSFGTNLDESGSSVTNMFTASGSKTPATQIPKISVIDADDEWKMTLAIAKALLDGKDDRRSSDGASTSGTTAFTKATGATNSSYDPASDSEEDGFNPSPALQTARNEMLGCGKKTTGPIKKRLTSDELVIEHHSESSNTLFPAQPRKLSVTPKSTRKQSDDTTHLKPEITSSEKLQKQSVSPRIPRNNESANPTHSNESSKHGMKESNDKDTTSLQPAIPIIITPTPPHKTYSSNSAIVDDESDDSVEMIINKSKHAQGGKGQLPPTASPNVSKNGGRLPPIKTGNTSGDLSNQKGLNVPPKLDTIRSAGNLPSNEGVDRKLGVKSSQSSAIISEKNEKNRITANRPSSANQKRSKFQQKKAQGKIDNLEDNGEILKVNYNTGIKTPDFLAVPNANTLPQKQNGGLKPPSDSKLTFKLNGKGAIYNTQHQVSPRFKHIMKSPNKNSKNNQTGKEETENRKSEMEDSGISTGAGKRLKTGGFHLGSVSDSDNDSLEDIAIDADTDDKLGDSGFREMMNGTVKT